MKVFSIIIFLCYLIQSSVGWTRTLKFSTLEWPPYLSESLPNKGFGIKILNAAISTQMNATIKVDFLPWSRALDAVRNNQGYAGCLLAYYSKERERQFYYSDPVISAPIHFIVRKDKKVRWENLEDLTNKRIGVVQDYVNSVELDRLISQKIIKADPALKDESNIEKLIHGRIDMAVIDKNVFKYLMKATPRFKIYADQLIVDPKVLDDKKLYVLFPKTPEGKKMMQIFNRGLKKINPRDIAQKELDNL